METLEELKNTYKKLQEESNNLYSKIRALENSKFTVGECYLDTRQDNLIKIVSVQGNYVYYMCLNNLSICRESSYLFYIQGWKKITSKQFKNAYLAVMKDFQDPDFEERPESNVLRYFRDNGELKKAFEIQKDSLTNMANSPWAKLVIGHFKSTRR